MIASNPAENPFLSGRYAPLRVERDVPSLPIEGTWPRALNGVLYRNGPNPRFAPKGPYHWFSGDGMVHAFTIAGGTVAYRNRWIRTPKWALEDAEGEALAPDDPRLIACDSTVANTNVVRHAGRLLTLEEAHEPFEIDPGSLASRGYHAFDGGVRGPMTAHPKVDPVTGELVFFGYGAAGPLTPDVSLGGIDRDGRLAWSARVVAPYASMVHDFAVTSRWIVLPIFPLTGSRERAEAGGPPFAWEPDKGTLLALIPRGGGTPRWFRGDARFVFHVMNAFDAPDGRVVCDVMQYDAAPLFPRADGTRIEPPPRARLVRWTIDPSRAADGFDEAPLDDAPGEFPRLDERFATRAYRHGYLMTSGDDATGTGLAHIDHATGHVVRWRSAHGDTCGEPVFVPRDPGAAEGDGWLLCTVYRGAEDRSDLAVFDARDLSAGPRALARLSHRVPAGFHGSFVIGVGADRARG